MVDIISLKIDNKINYTWEIIISGTLLGRHFISQLTKCNIIAKTNKIKLQLGFFREEMKRYTKQHYIMVILYW